MDTLQDRRDAFENKFAHDETLRFKAIARRNKLLGIWAAEALGHHGEVAAAYAEGVVQAGVTDPVAAVSKVAGDVAGRGFDWAYVAAKAAELLPVATEQVAKG
jgi:hypothetical protein